MDALSHLVLPGLQIVWINILLSGDNAVVIALACRNLDERQRRIGLLAGAGAAVGLRILFTLVTNSILGLPWLKFVGGLLLLYIAVKLLLDDHEENDVKPASNIWKAVQTIAIADIVMSLDNVLAIAAIADGHVGLIIFGLIISVPLVVAGSQLILAMLSWAPWIVWAGAALLGWVAGEIAAEDEGLIAIAGHLPHFSLPVGSYSLDIGIAPLVGAVFVLAVGALVKRRAVAPGTASS